MLALWLWLGVIDKVMLGVSDCVTLDVWLLLGEHVCVMLGDTLCVSEGLADMLAVRLCVRLEEIVPVMLTDGLRVCDAVAERLLLCVIDFVSLGVAETLCVCVREADDDSLGVALTEGDSD